MNVKPISQLIGTVFYPAASFASPAMPTKDQARRRSKLWELPSRWHCALVGTCFTIEEVERIARRCDLLEMDLSPYFLHSRVVGQCESRTEAAEMIQRDLDQRHALWIRRFAKPRGNAAVLALWREALTAGEIRGALWAALSHPDLDEAGGDAICGEVHMLGHEAGARLMEAQAHRALSQRKAQRFEDESAALLLTLSETRRDRDRQIAELQARLGETERRLQQVEHRERSTERTGGKTSTSAELEQRMATAEQIARDTERQNAVLRDRLARQTAELVTERERCSALRAAFEDCMALTAHLETAEDKTADDSPVLPRLAGRNILCVGGRTGMIDRYRRLVESSGARFMHHDGGQEETLHRIDDVVAGADIVLCQAGYVSHSAYWRVKEACKRRGLPCIYLKATGVGSFAEGLHGAVERRPF